MVIEGRAYTHYGSIYGVPVYLGDLDDEAPSVIGANRFWDWFIWAGWLQFVNFVLGLFNEGDTPYAILVKGELE